MKEYTEKQPEKGTEKQPRPSTPPSCPTHPAEVKGRVLPHGVEKNLAGGGQQCRMGVRSCPTHPAEV